MKTDRRAQWILALIVTDLFMPPLFSDEPIPGVDPAVLVAPKASPAFREVLKGAAWADAFAKASAALGDLEALAKSAHPEAGSRVCLLAPDGQAKELGVAVGEIISEVDGKPLYQHDIRGFRKKDEPQQITVVNVDGIARQLAIQPGPIGVRPLEIARPEMIYLRRGTRQPAWDILAAVGAAQCCANADLAETAWYRAIKAGYVQDAVSDYCGAQIAWRQGRGDEACSFVMMLQRRPDIPEACNVESLAYQLAIANFKIEKGLSKRMLLKPGKKSSAYPGNAAIWLNSIRDAYTRLPVDERRGPSPSEIASYVKTNLMRSMELHATGDALRDARGRQFLDTLVKGEETGHLSAASANYDLENYLMAPTVEATDVEMIVHATIHDTDQEDTSRQKRFSVGLVDCDTDESMGHGIMTSGFHLAGFRVNTDGRCWADQSTSGYGLGLVDRINAVEETTSGRRFTIRILHAAGRDEVWLDKRRLLYLPTTDKPKRIGFMLGVAGATADVRVDYYKLDPALAGVK